MLNFTSEILLQFYYQETSPAQTMLIKAALQKDWVLNEKFKVLTQSIDQFNTVKISPTKKTLNYIFNYAQKTVVEFTDHT